MFWFWGGGERVALSGIAELSPISLTPPECFTSNLNLTHMMHEFFGYARALKRHGRFAVLQLFLLAIITLYVGALCLKFTHFFRFLLLDIYQHGEEMLLMQTWK